MRILSHFTSGAYFLPILIADVLIPGQPTRGRPGYVAAAFWGSSPQAAFLSTRSPLHLPSSCTPRARPVPCAPLVLVPLLRVICLRCRPEALKRRHR
jgi:hypothetical protein